jgi:hypothetical protein
VLCPCGVGNNFLLIFETAPFFFVYALYVKKSSQSRVYLFADNITVIYI